jgi:hypothetical protein
LDPLTELLVTEDLSYPAPGRPWRPSSDSATLG